MSRINKDIVLGMCESYREVCDRLGRYSDHEGDEAGPTWYLFSQGKKAFANHVKRAIEWHEKGIARLKLMQAYSDAMRSRSPRKPPTPGESG